jgi:hypothetical protein
MIRLRFTAAAALMGAFSLSLGSIASGQGLTFERWNTVTSPSILLLQRDAVNVRVPNSTQVVASAEIPSNVADSYGGRLRGWVTAPQTGDYTFFVAGDDSAELWLSSDNSRFNRKLIAFNRNPTTARQWNKFASQRSQVVRLVQGQSYYLEAWMKENTSNDNLAVGWHRVDIPTYATSNFGAATGTWTAGTSGGVGALKNTIRSAAKKVPFVKKYAEKIDADVILSIGGKIIDCPCFDRTDLIGKFDLKIQASGGYGVFGGNRSVKSKNYRTGKGGMIDLNALNGIRGPFVGVFAEWGIESAISDEGLDIELKGGISGFLGARGDWADFRAGGEINGKWTFSILPQFGSKGGDWNATWF